MSSYRIDNKDELFDVLGAIFGQMKAQLQEEEVSDCDECCDDEEYVEDCDECECDDCLVLDYTNLIVEASPCPHCVRELLEGFLYKIKDKYDIED